LLTTTVRFCSHRDRFYSQDIIIADLTGLGPKVMTKLGFASDHQPSGRFLLLFNAIAGADRVPIDSNSFRYEEIGEAAGIPPKLEGHLTEFLLAASKGRIFRGCYGYLVKPHGIAARVLHEQT
jgi:hypothetical protein